MPLDSLTFLREKRIDSPWRNRPIEESLALFEDMRKGKFAEGEAVLRMKMNMQSDNPVMRDLIAYRIKYCPHPHIGSKWCIYPSYDYTHCIIDSLENITHSLCTLEFERRRESYNWLLDALHLYKPLVWEYSRLNLTHSVLSKRKLIKLVSGGFVRGWDDPRLPTIRGFRRRGYTSDAINEFCNRIGVTRSYNLIDYQLLEQCVREDLDRKCNRAMAVLEPLRVVLTNFSLTEHPQIISVPNHPKDASRGSHNVSFSQVIYIERSDFRLDDMKGYKRLAPGKEVGLLHAGCTIRCTEVIMASESLVSYIKATVHWDQHRTKPSGYIHWVADASPSQESLSTEIRLYDKLFKSKEPSSLEDWLSDLHQESLRIISNALIDSSLRDAQIGDRVQFERLGFFYVDPDSKPPNKIIWNRIVSLKEENWLAKNK